MIKVLIFLFLNNLNGLISVAILFMMTVISGFLVRFGHQPLHDDHFLCFLPEFWSSSAYDNTQIKSSNLFHQRLELSFLI
jgi:hypothetical protein